MTIEITPLSPWLLGQDTFHTEEHEVFQVGKEAPPRLTAVINADLDDSGKPYQRAGLTSRLDTTAGLAVTNFGSYIYVQDEGTIKKLDPSDWSETSPVTGLTADAVVRFQQHAGQLWWTNGEVCGAITSAGVATHWGMTVPATPTLGTTAGDLPAGRYLVACTLEDANGAESGCGKAALITLADATKDITVDVSSPDSNATHVNIYATSANQGGLFWCKQVTVGSLPTTLSTISVSTRPLLTQHMRGPIPADGIFSYMGFLLLFRDQVLFRNNGLSPHTFYVREHVRAYPDNIVAGAGLETGFWLMTDGGAWWISGESPATWSDIRKDSRQYAGGSLVIHGGLIPALETQALVALFLSEHGLMVGLPTGQLVALTQDRLHLSVQGYHASFAVRQLSTGVRQILFALND